MTNAELLRERAERLAAPAPNIAEQSLELMVFAVGAALYAVPLATVRGVLTQAVSPVPDVQTCVAGLINVRGQVTSVIDLAFLLDQTASPVAPSSAGCVLLLETRFGLIGCWLSTWPQVRRVDSAELRRPLSVQSGVTGVLMGTIALLDMAELLETLKP